MTLAPRSSRRALPLVLLLPLALAAAAHGRTLGAPFVFDDQHVVEQNATIKSFAALVARSDRLSPSSRIVTDVTLAVNYAVGRLDPFGYHLVNVAIHLAAASLLWLMGRELLRRASIPHADAAALAVAGVFALHPLNSQAVAYVAQRAESLAALLTVAGLHLLLVAQRASRTGSRLALGAAGVACQVLAIYAKSTALVGPVLWLLLVWSFPIEPAGPPRSTRLRAVIAAASLLMITTAVAVAVLRGTRGSAEAGFSLPGLTVRDYLLTQTHVLWAYVRMLLFPIGQSVDHVQPIQRHLDAPTVVAGIALLAAAAGALVILAVSPVAGAVWRALRTLAAGVLWFAVAVAPTSSVVPVIDVMVEHRVYLASFGLLLGIGALLATAVDHAGERGARWALVAVIALWGVEAAALHRRNAVWESPLALWSDAAEKAPAKVRPIANVGYALERAGDVDGAIRAYRKALALPPDGSARTQDLHRNLGAALAKVGRVEEAAQVLESALALDPFNAAVLSNLAICRLDLNDGAGAEEAARRALEIDPRLGGAHNTLGEALLARGDARGALAAFRRGAELDPDVAVRHFNVAVAAERLGELDVACDAAIRVALAARSAFDRQLVAELGSDLRCDTHQASRPGGVRSSSPR